MDADTDTDVDGDSDIDSDVDGDVDGDSDGDPPTGLLQPEHVVYEGAFRLPHGGGEGYSWEYAGHALTYYPDGDPGGDGDGHPGSLFGVGHDWNLYVSEISIPAPVNSRSVSSLGSARTIQPFRDIGWGLHGYYEDGRIGLEYLPPQGGQTTGKIHFCLGQHFEEDDYGPSHGWADLDMGNPAGLWSVGGQLNYRTNDYLFEIPEAWAATYTPGMRLATGRFRDGGNGGRGPNLFAYGPWNHGNPPSRGATLDAVALIAYSEFVAPDSHYMHDWNPADSWTCGAWLESGERSAVILVGAKALGEGWYGYHDGTRYPSGGEGPGERGWWADDFVARIIFYDPSELGEVARGALQPWEPQPYAHMDIGDRLFHREPRNETHQYHHVRGCAYDRARNILYVIEFGGDEYYSVIHAWRIQG